MVNAKVYILETINKTNGFRETIQYTGSLRNKPKGYKVIKCIGDKDNDANPPYGNGLQY